MTEKVPILDYEEVDQNGFIRSYTNVTLPPMNDPNIPYYNETKITFQLHSFNALDSHYHGGPVILTYNEEESRRKLYRCPIYSCMKTLKGNVSVGELKEELIEETGGGSKFFSPVIPGSYRPVFSTADLDCLDSPDRRQTLRELGYQFNHTTRWIPYNISLYDFAIEEDPTFFVESSVNVDELGMNPCAKSPGNKHSDLCDRNHTTTKAATAVPAHCIYNMGSLAMERIQLDVLRHTFTGQVNIRGSLGPGGYRGSEGLLALYRAGSGNRTLEDFQGIVRNVTDSLTTYIRQATVGDLSKPATGEMFDNTTCVQVRWAWLSYTAVIVGLLLIFFTWTVIYARISQSRLRRQWVRPNEVPPIHDLKSSALSFLYHGLDQESLRQADTLGASNQEKELEKSTKEITVRLVATEQGWKLSAVDH